MYCNIMASRVHDNEQRQTDREQSDREPTDPKWWARAIKEIFYYPKRHLAQTLTWLEYHLLLSSQSGAWAYIAILLN